MKRITALVLFVFSIISCSFAETEGIFVPSFQVYMDSFTSVLEELNEEFYEDLREDCFADGLWVGHADSWRTYDYYSGLAITIDEGNGFLEDISIEISKDKMEKYEEEFKDIILSAARSVLVNPGDSFDQSFFDNIWYDYTMDSPAGYLTMYYNCGVYRFALTKSSSGISFSINLSVYEVE